MAAFSQMFCSCFRWFSYDSWPTWLWSMNHSAIKSFLNSSSFDVVLTHDSQFSNKPCSRWIFRLTYKTVFLHYKHDLLVIIFQDMTFRHCSSSVHTFLFVVFFFSLTLVSALHLSTFLEAKLFWKGWERRDEMCFDIMHWVHKMHFSSLRLKF